MKWYVRVCIIIPSIFWGFFKLLFFQTLTSLSNGPAKQPQQVETSMIQHVGTVWLTYWNMLDHVGKYRAKFDFNPIFVPTSGPILFITCDDHTQSPAFFWKYCQILYIFAQIFNYFAPLCRSFLTFFVLYCAFQNILKSKVKNQFQNLPGSFSSSTPFKILPPSKNLK